MASAMHFFVESGGIRLPDGTVFGGGCEYTYMITKGEDIANIFSIYQVIGKRYVRIADPMRYADMKAWVDEQINHYNSCGMKLLLTNHADPKMQTYFKHLARPEDF